jgi:hypothetical protein
LEVDLPEDSPSAGRHALGVDADEEEGRETVRWRARPR